MNVSPNIPFICFNGDKLSCITTSSYSIDIIFCPNLYIQEYLIVSVCIVTFQNNNNNNDDDDDDDDDDKDDRSIPYLYFL